MAASFIHLSDRHRQLLALIRAHWGRLALSMICMLVIAGATAATAYLITLLVATASDRNRLALETPVTVPSQDKKRHGTSVPGGSVPQQEWNPRTRRICATARSVK